MSSLIGPDKTGHLSSPSQGVQISSPSAAQGVQISSPDVSVGPPGSPGSLYPYLGLYQQLLGAHHPFPHHHFPPAPNFPMNPLILAAASQNPFLAYSGLGPLAVIDRIKQNRFSPYPVPSHPTSFPLPPLNSDSRSAFRSVGGKKAPSPARRDGSPVSPPPASPPHAAASDIKNIEAMVQQLNGTRDQLKGSRDNSYGISHDRYTQNNVKSKV